MNFSENPVCKLLDIKLPLIQAGMVWVSGARLAAASAQAGILGVVGAGSMQPELLREQLMKAKTLTGNSLAVNIPLFYSKAKEQIDVALQAGIKIFITSAGSPKLYTSYLKDHGCKVLHVISTPDFAVKSEQAGVDAVIAEGFEAGGHNGRDELTTMVLIPQVLTSISIPVIAAGGIATGAGVVAALSLGAHGVQMGTRFVCTEESSAHPKFKQLLIESAFNSTMLSMKKEIPVRLYKNKFYQQIQKLEDAGASSEKINELLGKGRAKKGIFEGDLEEGELEIGQICSLIKDIPTVSQLVQNLKEEITQTLSTLERITR
ncbi:MAG: nitronate monooxygenase [Bacteriovoracaceae bacterium]|nr:nitronate monooxygenase [Bacteriovoracaceae bacterium]